MLLWNRLFWFNFFPCSGMTPKGQTVQGERVLLKLGIWRDDPINIILSFGKEYVKFAWWFTGKPGRENWDFWHLKTWKTNNIVHIEVLCILERHWWKVRVGVSSFLTFKNIWHDLNYKNANNFLGFKLPQKYAYWIPLYIRSRCWKNDMLSFQIKASHLHIGPKWLR